MLIDFYSQPKFKIHVINFEDFYFEIHVYTLHFYKSMYGLSDQMLY